MSDINFDPTRAKCIRLDGSELALPFIKQAGQTKLNINGKWFPLVMTRGEFQCGSLSFKRIYYPQINYKLERPQ